MRLAAMLAGFLLIASWPGNPVHAQPDNTKGGELHDIKHPLVLKTDADFLAALIVLYDNSLQASLAASKRVQSKAIKDYAARAARGYRSELPKLQALLARHGTSVKPDFHYQKRMPELTKLSGTAAEKYYLSGSSKLLADKIELAEFAIGTVKSLEVKKLAGKVIEKRSIELAILLSWLESYQKL